MPLQHSAFTYGPHKNAHICAVHMHHLTHMNTYTHWSCHRFHGELRSCGRMWEFLPLSSVVFPRIPTLDTKKQTEAKRHRRPWCLSGSMGNLEWMNRQALIKTELSHMHAAFSILQDWQRTEALCMRKGMKNGTGNHASVERKKKKVLFN